MSRVVVLAGGVGGARFLLGARAVAGSATNLLNDVPPLTVIGNVGDDFTLYGLRICPDLDTVMYTLGGGVSAEQGWGRSAETFAVRDELSGYRHEAWFTLGDRDIATHLLRTQLLAERRTLSEVTAQLCGRWRPGVRLLPASDQPAETHVQLRDGRSMHFQEWWVRWHAEPAVDHFVYTGAPAAEPAPGVTGAIEEADAVILAPSNPVVSIGAILSIRGIADAVRATRAAVVGVSPIIAGSPVRGMADACLAAVGVATSAQAVAEHYGLRGEGGLIDGWLVDEADAAAAEVLGKQGYRAAAVPLLMKDEAATAAMVRAALELAGR
jgi:LPPG:FO 2-phospho-L-lactate transferase